MADSYYAELENGIKVISRQFAADTHYGLECNVQAGEKHVAARQNGLPHFLEHLIFSGTSRMTSADIDNLRQNLRGHVGAATFNELTNFSGSALQEDGNKNLIKLSDLIASILSDSVIPEDRIEHEREVILNELYERQDNLSTRLFEMALSNSFGNHPYSRKIIGTPQTVSSFERQDFIKFMQEFYNGNRMTIGVIGPDPAEEMAGTVIESFLKIKSMGAPSESLSPQFHEGEDRNRTSEFLAQNHFRICVPFSFSMKHAHYYAGDFIGEMMGKRLFSLRDRFSKSYGLTANFVSYSDTSFLMLGGCTRPQTSDDFLKVSAEIIRSIRDGFSQEEFNNVLIPKAREMETIHRFSFPYMNEMMGELTWRDKQFDPQERLASYRGISYDYANDFLKHSMGNLVSITHMGPTTDFMSLDLFKELAFGQDHPGASLKAQFGGPKHG